MRPCPKERGGCGSGEREARLAAEIDELLRRAQEEDAKEDEELGEWKDRTDGVAPEILRRESRKEFIRKHHEQLEEEANMTRAAELRDLAKANDARKSAEADSAAAKAAETRAGTRPTTRRQWWTSRTSSSPPASATWQGPR